MKTKSNDELFIFSSGVVQSYPNKTNNDSASVVKKSDYVRPVIDTSSQTEYNWAKSEIESAVIQLSKCEFAEANSDNERATCNGTSEAWTQYIIDLRYYATYSEESGYALRLDERPTITLDN